jgi:hypothetical protein
MSLRNIVLHIDPFTNHDNCGPTCIRNFCEWKNILQKKRHLIVLRNHFIWKGILLPLTNVRDECRTAVIVKGSIQKNQCTTSNYHTETFISTEGWRRPWWQQNTIIRPHNIFVEVYEKSTNSSTIWKRDARPITSMQSHAPNKKFNDTVLYGQLKFWCIDGGEDHKSSSLGKYVKSFQSIKCLWDLNLYR